MTPSTDEKLLPVIRAALDQTRSAACITTADLDRPGPTIVYVNPAYCKMIGCSAADVIGLTPRIMQGPLTSRRVLDRLRSDLEAGRHFVGETVNYRKGGRPFMISWRIDPVLDQEGTTTHYIATQEDITVRRRNERLLKAEQAIDRSVSTLLSRPADADTNVRALTADIANAIAGLVDYGHVGVIGSIRLGTTRAEFRAGTVDRSHDRSIETARLSNGDSVSGTSDGRRWVGCSLTSERSGIDGAIVVTDLDKAELDFIDRSGLERAVACARRALDSVAEYERQRLVAIELQQGLLPEAAPLVANLDLSAHYQPGAFATRVGGDWYDVFQDDTRTVLVVGDIAGSGIRAAADMGRLRLLTRVLLQQGASVSDVLATLNTFCSDEDLIATVLAVTIDGTGEIATVVSAGHLPPVVRRAAATEILTVAPGPLLGMGGTPHYPEQPLTLDAETTVVMFTDGLVERADEPIDRSLDRLAGDVADDHGEVAGLCERLIDRRLLDSPSDDIAVLAFRSLRRPAERHPAD